MRLPHSKQHSFYPHSKSRWARLDKKRSTLRALSSQYGRKLSLEPLEERAMLSHSSAVISGEVVAAGDPWSHAQVTLYQAKEHQAKAIGTDATDANGHFDIDYRRVAAGSQLYVVVSNGKPSHGSLLFVGVAGEVGPDLHQTLVVNEFSTVSSVYALSQFIDGVKVSGDSPGLDNAFATTFNLVDPSTGTPGSVVSNANNGVSLSGNPPSTLALQTLNTLADVLAACVTDHANCETLFDLTTVDGARPTNTIEAIQNIVHNPASFDNQALFDLAATQTIYTPILSEAPDAWIVALHYTDGGFNAPGRIAFDAQGNVWSNNNFQLPIPGTEPGMQITVLSPTGEPIFGSPIEDNGVLGSAYGVAIAPDGNVWIGNYADSSMSVFKPDGTPLRHITSQFGNLDHPMGLAFDQQGNAWIPNMGDPSDPGDFGSVTVYLKGNPKKALTFTRDPLDPLAGIHKPFSIAVDAKGRAWVANSGLGPVGSVSVLELKNGRIRLVKQITRDTDGSGDDSPFRPFGEFASPRTIAIDSHGNAWMSNFENNLIIVIDGKTFETREIEIHESSNGWGLAIDGSDRTWIGSFTNAAPNMMSPPFVSVIQGDGADGEFLYSFTNPSLQHITALQLDASGNVWAVNNWALETTPSQIVGGDGLVEFIGLATPVKTPLVDQYDRGGHNGADIAERTRELFDAVRERIHELLKRQRHRGPFPSIGAIEIAHADADHDDLGLLLSGDERARRTTGVGDEQDPGSRPSSAVENVFDQVFAQFNGIRNISLARFGGK